MGKMKSAAIGPVVILSAAIAFTSPKNDTVAIGTTKTESISDSAAKERADALMRLEEIGVGIIISVGAAAVISRWKPRRE